MSNCFWGIYSNNLERFILFDEDRWILFHTAKLLSSKFSLCVCSIDSKFKNVIPLEYGLSNPSIAKQDQQVPLLITEVQNISIKDAVKDIPVDILIEQIEYAKLSLNFVRASWITDAMYNNADHRFYLNLIDETNIPPRDDAAGSSRGFRNSIDRIIFLSNNKEELESSLIDVFNTLESSRPTNLKIYKNTFYKILGEMS
jgi:hypothetical protein